MAGVSLPPVISAGALRRELFASRDLWSTEVHATLLHGGLTSAESAPYVLQYMPMRNRAEVPRLMLEAVASPYAFEVVGFRAWPHVKPRTPFGKTPTLLVDYDASRGGPRATVSHEQAITRYLASELGLDGGPHPLGRARCDELYAQYWSTVRNHGLTHEGELYNPVALREAIEKGEEDVLDGPRYREMPRVNTFSVAHRSVAALRVFEDILAETQGGAGASPTFLTGKTLTYVDLALYETLAELAEPDLIPHFAQLLNLPRLAEFLQRVDEIPEIQSYVGSDRRIPRYTRPGYIYLHDDIPL